MGCRWGSSWSAGGGRTGRCWAWRTPSRPRPATPGAPPRCLPVLVTPTTPAPRPTRASRREPVTPLAPDLSRILVTEPEQTGRDHDQDPWEVAGKGRRTPARRGREASGEAAGGG